MCGQFGLVHTMLYIFSYGYKSARLFGRNLSVWDFFLKVTMDFNQSLPHLYQIGHSNQNSPHPSPARRGPNLASRSRNRYRPAAWRRRRRGIAVSHRGRPRMLSSRPCSRSGAPPPQAPHRPERPACQPALCSPQTRSCRILIIRAQYNFQSGESSAKLGLRILLRTLTSSTVS